MKFRHMGDYADHSVRFDQAFDCIRHSVESFRVESAEALIDE
jgi:hypothetical protein